MPRKKSKSSTKATGKSKDAVGSGVGKKSGKAGGRKKKSGSGSTASSAASAIALMAASDSLEDAMHGSEMRSAQQWLDWRRKRKTSGRSLAGFVSEAQFLKTKEAAMAEWSYGDGFLKKVVCAKRAEYRNWFVALRSGFSLLLYGLGSKKQIVSDFASRYLTTDGALLVLNGYFKGSLARKLCADALRIVRSSAKRPLAADCASLSRDPMRAAHSVCAAVRRSGIRLYVAVNSMDCVDAATRKVLCVLANGRGIHLLATMDSANALLCKQSLVRGSMSAQLAFYAVECHSGMHFDSECSLRFEAPTVDASKQRRGAGLRQSQMRQRMGLRHLLDSLTPVHLELLAFVAQSAASDPLSYQQLFETCYAAMLVDSEVKFRALIQELKDHCAIREQRHSQTEATLQIPYDADVVQMEVLCRHEVVAQRLQQQTDAQMDADSNA